MYRNLYIYVYIYIWYIWYVYIYIYIIYIPIRKAILSPICISMILPFFETKKMQLGSFFLPSRKPFLKKKNRQSLFLFGCQFHTYHFFQRDSVSIQQPWSVLGPNRVGTVLRPSRLWELQLLGWVFWKSSRPEKCHVPWASWEWDFLGHGKSLQVTGVLKRCVLG